MTDLPKTVEIHEEGPREGFQIEPGPISTADKIRVIEALAETGLHHIQVCSFVNPRVVPGWADAEQAVAGLQGQAGRALHRAVVQRERAQPGAGVQGQADHQRQHLADRVGGLYPQEPQPQPRAKTSRRCAR